MTIKNINKYQYFINVWIVVPQNLCQRATLQLFPVQKFFVQKQVSWHLLRIMHVRNINDRIQNALWILIPGKEI